MTRRRNLTSHPALVVSPLADFGSPWDSEEADAAWRRAFDDFRSICWELDAQQCLLGTHPDMAEDHEPPRPLHLVPVLPDGFTEQPLFGDVPATALALFNRERTWTPARVTTSPAGIFSPWEADDAATCPHPGAYPPSVGWYLKARTRTVMVDSEPWERLRGLRDCDDSQRYIVSWPPRHRQVSVSAFLGWPAYLISVAQDLGSAPCRECGKPTPVGREYCGSAECNRARARERKRAARDARAHGAGPSGAADS